MQLLFTLLAFCICVRCLECGVQGQMSECASGRERCYDLDLRMHLEPKRYGRRDLWTEDDYEPRRWADERWGYRQSSSNTGSPR